MEYYISWEYAINRKLRIYVFRMHLPIVIYEQSVNIKEFGIT